MTTCQPLWADNSSLPYVYAAVTFAGCRKAGKAAALAAWFELPSTALVWLAGAPAHDCPFAVALIDCSASPVFCFFTPAGAGGQGLFEGRRALPPNPVAGRLPLPLPKPLLTVPLLLPNAAGGAVPLTGPLLIKASKERFCGFDEVAMPAPVQMRLKSNKKLEPLHAMQTNNTHGTYTITCKQT